MTEVTRDPYGNPLYELHNLTKKRNDLCVRLVKSLEHLPLDVIINVITGWIPINQLELLVKAQEEHKP